MLHSLLLLFAGQLLGQIAADLLGLPVPGAVLGFAFMLALLIARPGLATALAPAADGLLRHLGLLFVPAGVGIILYFDLLREEWLPLVVSLIVSTLIGMAATALIFDRLLKRAERRDRSAP
ncbi:MAG: CidA/LrgA family protein [Alphaproteobacteria bacterium]